MQGFYEFEPSIAHSEGSAKQSFFAVGAQFPGSGVLMRRYRGRAGHRSGHGSAAAIQDHPDATAADEAERVERAFAIGDHAPATSWPGGTVAS